VQEYPGHDQPGDVGGQDCLAARLGGQPAEPEQDHQQQFDLRLGDAVTEVLIASRSSRGSSSTVTALTTTKTMSSHPYVANRPPRASTVPRSVMKQAARMSLPRS